MPEDEEKAQGCQEKGTAALEHLSGIFCLLGNRVEMYKSVHYHVQLRVLLVLRLPRYHLYKRHVPIRPVPFHPLQNASTQRGCTTGARAYGRIYHRGHSAGDGGLSSQV